jgi:hypothetical protein
MPIFNKFVDFLITLCFTILEIKELIGNVFTGYYNFWLATFNLIDNDEIDKHDIKAKICTSDCPLQGKLFGVTVCDFRKEHDGINGCGCVRSAKLWSDSVCPLGKF